MALTTFTCYTNPASPGGQPGYICHNETTLEAGVHFGHQTRRWDPRMSPFIFTERNGIHILDLQQTVGCLDDAITFVRDIVTTGKDVLIVGTKKQAKETVEEEAQRAGLPYVSNRWLGGTLTNFRTIQSRTQHLRDLEDRLSLIHI